MLKLRLITGSLALVLVLAAVSFAADTEYVDVKAYIPQQNGLTVAVSKVEGTTWTDATSIDFGNLVFDADNNIFTADYYYAVDVGINSNAADWTVTHSTSSMVNAYGESLDNNVNVAFMKQVSNTSGSELEKVSYADSDGKAYTKSALTGGWLRIYYGVATGDGTDAPNTTPIASTTTFGNYQGRVTLTLTP